jgi:glutathione S-transferase
MTRRTSKSNERYTLIIGNKNYSTWSLRSWLLMRAKEIPFNEFLLPLDTDEFEQKIHEYSPSGYVPVLIDGETSIWDSLAIAEYLAEIFPEKHLWPADAAARARARSISAEMHSGFPSLRRELPMNLRRPIGVVSFDKDAQRDIYKIFEIWRGCREEFGSAGSFLFGDFTVADAFYAPVATRFRTYGLELDEIVGSYVKAIHELPAFREWQQAAMDETWVVEADEL